MKKIATAILLFITCVTFAQKRERKDVEITPTVGFARALYYGAGDTKSSELNSGNFGAVCDVFFSNRWSFHSGILFQTMGGRYRFNDRVVKETLKYVTVPINASWHFGSTRKWYLNFGPTLGILTGAESDGFDISDETEPAQVGLNVGIGYKIKITNKFSISVDYQSMAGLTEVGKNTVNVFNSHDSFNFGGVIKI